jgi:hypothetical protein
MMGHAPAQNSAGSFEPADAADVSIARVRDRTLSRRLHCHEYLQIVRFDCNDNDAPDEWRQCTEEGSMYRTAFLIWLAAMAIFAADVIYLGWDLVAVAAGLN